MTDGPLIAVLDYGIGNLRSAEKGLERVGADARLTSDRTVIERVAGVVLPGVGAFGRCMAALRESGLEPVARAAVESGRPFLGICIGMQMLFDHSEENPDAPGLGVVPGAIRLLPEGVKRPADPVERPRRRASLAVARRVGAQELGVLRPLLRAGAR